MQDTDSTLNIQEMTQTFLVKIFLVIDVFALTLIYQKR